MHHDIQMICDALDRLADAAILTFPHQTDLPFTDYWSWQAPPITRQDVAWEIRSIVEDLRLVNPDRYSEPQQSWVMNVPATIAYLQSSTLPTAYGGNQQAFAPLLATIRHIRAKLLPAVGWAPVPDRASMPVPLARRVAAAKGRVEELELSLIHI